MGEGTDRPARGEGRMKEQTEGRREGGREDHFGLVRWVSFFVGATGPRLGNPLYLGCHCDISALCSAGSLLPPRRSDPDEGERGRELAMELELE